MRRHRPAFTLVEVLMGILILALALLGIGAVIPVVVRTQKIATDATLSVSIANGAESLLARRADLNRLTPIGGGGRQGWGVWLLDPNWSPACAPVGTAAPSDAYLWETFLTGGAPELDPATGRIYLQFSGGTPVAIEVADRFGPPRNSAGIAPQFVWDFIARRVRTGLNEPHQIQLAIFVRRIDPNIRVPNGLTIYEVLSGFRAGTLAVLSAPDRRLPVAVATAPPATAGLPSLNGLGDYAAPLVLDLEDTCLDPQRRDRIRTIRTSVTPAEFSVATQVGQKWVDNLGNIYTVRGVDPRDAAGEWVLIDPPVPSWVRDITTGTAGETAVRQVAFVPHVPAAVSVVTLTPTDPKP